MRASATAPSLAISNASRKDYTHHQTWRATVLLTRMATSSAQQGQAPARRPSSSSVPSSPESSPEGMSRKDFEAGIFKGRSTPAPLATPGPREVGLGGGKADGRCREQIPT